MLRRRLGGRAVLLTLGILTGAAIVGTPVGGHVGDTVSHVWNHLKPKADARYVNEREMLWAAVNSDGSLARGSGVAAVAGSNGVYRVYFKRSVTSCAFGATVGLAGSSGIESPGLITVVGTAMGGPGGLPLATGVLVSTYNLAGGDSARGFHLTVTCSHIASPAQAVGARKGPTARRGTNR